jgi:hypothetical protein
MEFLLAFLFAIVHPADTPGGPIPLTVVVQPKNADTPGGPIPLKAADTPGGPIPVKAADTPGGPIPLTSSR